MPSDTQSRSGSLLSNIGIIATYLVLKTLLPERREASPPAADFGAVPSRLEPVAVHRQRVAEPGRGRRAASPRQIPWRGWKDVLWRTYEQIQQDRLLAISAGVVFYGLLALFPAITALVSLYGLFATASSIHEHLAFLSSFLPDAAVSVIDEQIGRVVSKGDARLSFGFIAGLGVALWSANAGMKALIDALNIVYEEDEKRGFIKLNLISLAFTLGAIAALLLAVGAVVALPLILTQLGLASLTGTVIRIGRWPMLMAGILVAIAVLYRYGASRTEPKWKWVSVGSVLASVLWIAGSAALSLYLSRYAHYDVAYGSLGTAIGLMTWMWMTTIVILFGAELNSEIEHQTAVDTTEGPEKPLGSRGATMADTVGAARV